MDNNKEALQINSATAEAAAAPAAAVAAVVPTSGTVPDPTATIPVEGDKKPEAVEAASGVKRPAMTETTATTTTTAAATPATAAGAPPPKKKTSALQLQIQQQLQEQLQAQLQAAAEKGQQANITPEQIQAQAAAMVQAAAQAQAVVAAAKSRNQKLQPMNHQQIAALSQIQAAAIVQARKLPASQVQAQIQIQAQALVHAHTQAQIQAGIYKDDAAAFSTTSKPDASGNSATAAAPPSAPGGVPTPVAPSLPSPAAVLPVNPAPPATTSLYSSMDAAAMATGNEIVQQQQDSNSPAFQQQLHNALQEFWVKSSAQIHALQNQSEQDFKNHNDLPLARIKRIMKSDEDVRMISAEAPVLFAKACELFILDLSIRSWNYSQLHKRRTLQKEDVKEAIQKTDVFDFLVDVIQ